MHRSVARRLPPHQLLAVAAITALGGGVSAQTTELQQITVTAERRVENGASVSEMEGPPIVSSSRPATTSSVSRICSRSSRRRLARQSNRFSASAATHSARRSLA